MPKRLEPSRSTVDTAVAELLAPARNRAAQYHAGDRGDLSSHPHRHRPGREARSAPRAADCSVGRAGRQHAGHRPVGDLVRYAQPDRRTGAFGHAGLCGVSTVQMVEGCLRRAGRAQRERHKGRWGDSVATDPPSSRPADNEPRRSPDRGSIARRAEGRCP
jgi:hypothetical protein